MNLKFYVDNSRVQIENADPFILGELDRHFKYPTQIAHMKENDYCVADTNWDGWVRLLRIPKRSLPWIPTGLLEYAKHICNQVNYVYVLDDKRERPLGDIPEIAKIDLRDYQKEAIDRGVSIGRGIFDLPPRSGKTRLMCDLQNRLAVPTIWMAPTDRIVKQTVKVLKGFFGNNYATQVIGSKMVGSIGRYRVVVATASTASNLPSEFYATRQCIIVDEFHHAAAKSYKKIFDKCDHIFHRFGMTGTWFRSGDDALEMHALISNPIYRVSSKELLDLGYLVPCHAVFLPVICPHLRNVPSQMFNVGHGKMGIHEHVFRNQLVAYVALFLYQMGRKTLILVGTKKQGYMIREILRSLLLGNVSAQFNAVEFISTDVDRYIQGQVLKSFENGEEVKVLIGTSILGEGVDLPSSDALVYARGESAEVTLTQAIYRVVTAVEGKTNAIVVDFADRHHRHLLKHSRERLSVYYNEAIFNVSVLSDTKEFPMWLNSVPKS